LHPVQNQERRATKKGFSVAKSAFNIKKIIHTHSIVNSLLNEQQNYSVAKNDANCFFFFFF